MVSAVAGPRAYATAPAAPPDAQAQLQHLQHQLSDNVNCASATTREGKATIAAIEEKISALKHRIDDPQAATATVPSAARIGSTSGGVIDV